MKTPPTAAPFTHPDQDVVSSFRPHSDILLLLLEIDSHPYMKEHLYFYILKCVDEQKSSNYMGVVVLLQMAFVHYARINFTDPLAKMDEDAKMPKYIDALVEDEKVNSAAKAYWSHIRANAGHQMPPEVAEVFQQLQAK